MRSTVARMVLLGTSLAVGCTGSGGGDRAPGTESFVAQAPNGGARNTGTAGAATGAVPATPQPAAADAGARAVVEGDLYALDGTTLYVLNGFRGLQIVDLADPAHPALQPNGVRATGTPVDLYLRGGIAYFTVSDSVVWAWAADAGGVAPRGGSQVWAVDVSNPKAPQVLSRLDVEGSAVETRIVGDVLYVFSRRWGWWDYGYGYAAAGGVSSGVAVPAGTAVAGGASANPYYLASFDLTHPSAPVPVQVVTFDATGWDAHAHITAERVTFAQSRYEASGPRSQFQLFDISDPGGAIRPGATFDAPGQVVDRWAMDFAGGVFRAVLADGWSGGATLRSWTSPSVDSAEPAGPPVSVGAGEQLTAARFDAARAYIVTARSYDPLFVVDTSDPAQPKLGGEVVMPGQLDFIEPRGTRLVALGHTNESGAWQLAVSVFDVADVLRPLRTSVATVGGADWAWLGASRDDMRKAFQVLDGDGLVLVPFQGWDRDTYRWAGGLQVFDLDLAAGTVIPRPLAAHRGAITRAFPLRSTGLLCALSDQRLQVLAAARGSAPTELAHLDLARPVIDLAFVNDKAVELSGDWLLGDTALVVTEPLEPDTAAPLVEVPLAAPQAQLFTVGSTAWLLAQDWGFTGGRAWLQGVDLTAPASPRVAGRLDLTPGAGGSGGWSAWWGYGDEAALVGSVLAVHRQFWRGPLVAAAGASSAAPQPPGDEVLLYDLSDVDAPRLAGRVALDGSDWSWGLTASGGSLWLTEFTWSGGSANDGRYHLLRIDLSRPDAPRLASKVNVPGIFLGAAAGGGRVFVVETVWPDGGAAPARSFVRALDLTDHGTARLAASVELEGYPSGALVDGARAYVATSRWSSSDVETSLAAVDLAAMRLASSQPLASQGWASPLRAAGGKLFLTAWARGNVVLVYDLADPARPAFEQAVPNPGWVRGVAVRGEYAYLPSGPYGVPMVKLAR